MNHEAKTVKEHLESGDSIVATITPKKGCDTISVKGGEKEFCFNVNPNFPNEFIRNMVRNMLSGEQKKRAIIIERSAMTA